MHRSGRTLLVVGVFAASACTAASAQFTKRTAITDSQGARTETLTHRIGVQSPIPTVQFLQGLIWHYNDPVAITESVAVSGGADTTWLGQNLNSERFQCFQTTGNGTPLFEYDALGADSVFVSAAEDTALGVAAIRAGTSLTIHGFDRAQGNTPIWSYQYDEEYSNVPNMGVDVSADGGIVAAVVNKPSVAEALVVILDGTTGAELNRLAIAAFCGGIELSDDGARAVVTVGDTARIIETAGMTTLHSFNTSGAGGFHRISRNGQVACAGGFNWRVYKEISGTWTLIYSGSAANNWFGAGMGLSGDGDTLFMVSYNYASGYLLLTYRIIDLVQGVELHNWTTQGSGGFQDTVVRAQASYDGSVLACASWGTENNVHPEVQIFDRDANSLGSIDMPGSPFSLDMSRDGRFVVAGGKHVHANTFGNGGDAYAYEIEIGVLGDMNCDGALDGADIDPFFLALGDPDAYRNAFPNCNLLNGDINGDDSLDGADIDGFFACLGGNCP